MKMRRLAEIFRVDVAAIHEMWIVQSAEEESKRLFTDLQFNPSCIRCICRINNIQTSICLRELITCQLCQ